MTSFEQSSFFDDDPQYAPGHGSHTEDIPEDTSSDPLADELDRLTASPEDHVGGQSGLDTQDAGDHERTGDLASDQEDDSSAGAETLDTTDPGDAIPSDTGPDQAATDGDTATGALSDEAAECPTEVVGDAQQPLAEDPASTVSADVTAPFAAVSPTSALIASDLDSSSFFADPSGEPEVGTAPQPTPHAVMSDPGQEAVNAFFGPGRLDRPRPQREPLVARWVWIALAAAIGIIVLAVAGVWIAAATANISVPNLAGVDVDTARARLAQEGLKLQVAERRFSPSTSGIVLGQDPSASTKVRRGDTVAVVVSAGTEAFALPNVVGNGVLLARGLLESRGLDVRVESVPSQQPSDTVLASDPAAGTQVHTGDVVRLTVAAPGPSASLLLPYDLSGVKVVIDPAPVNDAQTDVPLDVARRLRALIEASHGTVVATRALATASTLDALSARAQRAGATTSTVAIGLSAIPAGSGGLVIIAPSPVLAHATASTKLASRVASDLATEAGAVKSASSTTDTVLAAANAPWIRVQLGSFGQRQDVAKFSDASWEDSVARGLYRAIASLYGKKTAAQ